MELQEIKPDLLQNWRLTLFFFEQVVNFFYFFKGLNQVHVENYSFSPHPQPLSQRARGAGKAFEVPFPKGEGLKPSAYMKRVRETLGFKLDEA